LSVSATSRSTSQPGSFTRLGCGSRETLGDSAEHPRFIEALPRHGYRFIVPVSERPCSDQPAAARLEVLPFLNLSGDPAQE
jgi:hypothetical protein